MNIQKYLTSIRFKDSPKSIEADDGGGWMVNLFNYIDL